jgi:DNA gyrase/topoisomerase IV subunit A
LSKETSSEFRLKKDDKLQQSSVIGSMHYESLSTSALIARGAISKKQKQVATNYMVIKRVFGFSAVHSRITNAEAAILAQYNFTRLENTNIKQINQELEMLQKWANSAEEALKNGADEVFAIRVKELKFLHSAGWINPSYAEIYDGYRALEKYVEFIAD